MTNQTEQEGIYLELKGCVAIHFNQTTNELDVYAYDRSTKKIIESTRLPFRDEDNDPWIILSTAEIVAELPVGDVGERVVRLIAGSPHTAIQPLANDPIHAPLMTSEIPPKKTNRVTPLQ